MAKQSPLTKVDIPPGKGEEFLNRLQERLRQGVAASQKSLLDWTMEYRRFDGRLPEMPFLIQDIYQDMHPELCIMKAAQVGISEYGINTVLWGADTGWGERGVCLYVFPKQDQIDDFSQDRVMRAISGSTYLTKRVNQVDRSDNMNRVRLRRVGGHPIYFRGSDSIAQTRSIDADILICDEVDLFREGAVARVRERLGSAREPIFRAFSQPLYPGGPIDLLFEQSDKRYYHLRCERCKKTQKLEWEHNVEFNLTLTDIHVICRYCKKPIDRLAQGHWEPENTTAYMHGYHMSKLYSPRANLLSILHKSLNVADPQDVQSFYNADLGIPHRPEGTPGLEEFKKEAYPWEIPLAECYMGIDPGDKLHLSVIGRDHHLQDFRLLYRRPFDSFDEVEKTWQIFQPRLTIIDGQGDPRATLEWAKKHSGRVKRWFHRPAALQQKSLETGEIFLHRTSLLDGLYSALKTHQVILHSAAGPEFWKHMENNIREVVKDSMGRLIHRYTAIGPDHYAFAMAFAILAAGIRGNSQFQMNTIAKEAYVTSDYKAEDPDRSEKEISTGPDWLGYRSGSGGTWGRWKMGK